MAEEEIQPEAEQCEAILFKPLRIGSTKRVRSSQAGDDRELMRVNERPCSGIRGPLPAVEQPHKRDNEEIVCVCMAELVPPVDANCADIRSTTRHE
jgi:hypothetical protein